MLPRRHFRLYTLGRLTLVSVAGETEQVQEARPRHLAVLAVLAFATRPVTRDTLVGLFWGGEEEDRARRSLSNALSALRSLLGPNAITARRDDVGLADDAQLEVDAPQFAAACEVHNDEHAAALYAGPLLAGVHVPDALAFDRWLSRERSRLERQFLQVCERLAPTLLKAGRWTDAAGIAHRWLEAAPDSSVAFVTLLRASSSPGTPAALRNALDEFEHMRKALTDSHGVRPAAAVNSLAVELREQLSAAEQQLAAAVAPAPPAITVPEAPAVVGHPAPSQSAHSVEARADRAASPARSRGLRRWWPAAAGTVVVSLVLLATWAALRSPATAREAGRPVVAVVAIDDVRGDSSIAWLRAGLPRLIANGLDAEGGLEVVAPSRVRDAIVRLAGSSPARLTGDQAADVARRLGAGWVVTGGISTANGGYLLDVTAQSLASAGEHESFTVFGSSPIELGKLAAARLGTLLSVAPGGSGSAARYSGIETANPDAYRHYVRGMQAVDAERLTESARELDAAIALDSGFAEALRLRAAVAGVMGDAATSVRVATLARRFESRLPELERRIDEIRDADSLGESARAEALSIQLVTRFPHDPRAHSLRADLLTNHGQWQAADSVLVGELALDSLAMSAGGGPCTPCEVLWRLAQVRLAEGNRAGAEAAARRWVTLQPDLPAAWRSLSATLAAVGRPEEAVDAGYHDVALSREALAAVDFGRTMLSARRYDIVDSLLKAWRGTQDPVLAAGARDLLVMLQRERGQFAASVETLAHMPNSGITLLEADGFARLGRMAEARRVLEESGHHGVTEHSGHLTAPEARGFTWAHALEADELLRAGDTSSARPLLDSIARAGAQSYYGRDRIMHHHVRGMLYFAERRYADAEAELRAAEWGAGAWTRTNIELARAQLVQGHTKDAIGTLCDAYLAPLDGMGRYVPRSEIDWWMARAFSAGGQADSSARYAGYVRAAWRDADPAVRARLDSLPQ